VNDIKGTIMNNIKGFIVDTVINLISKIFKSNFKIFIVTGITLLVSAITGTVWYIKHRFNEYETTITNLHNTIIDIEKNNTTLTNNNLVLSKALDDQNEQIIELRNKSARKINELNAFIKMSRKDRYTGKLKDVLATPSNDSNLTTLIDKAMELKYEDF
jgi:predicted PurR-regulated permease PerM